MRTKGITGPAFAKHCGTPGLSKSAGNQLWTILVPNVIGMTEANAIAAIEGVGLVALRVGGNISGNVSLQDPAAGTGVAEGSTVEYELEGT